MKIAENFGDIITADHKVLNEDQGASLHHKYAVVVKVLAARRKTLQKKEKRDIQIRILEYNTISGALWDVTFSRYHVAPRTKLYVPEDDFSDTETKTIIDVLREATIGDYRKILGDMSPSKPWIGVTRFVTKKEIHQKDVCGFKADSRKKRVAARPGNTWPEEWSNMSTSCQRKATKKRFEEKRKLDAAREPRGTYSILDDDPDCGEFVNDAESKLEIRRASPVLCKVTTPANPNGSSWCDSLPVVGLRWKKQTWFSKLISTKTDVKNEKTNHKDIAAWSFDTKGHAQKCVERQCASDVSTPCFDDHRVKPEDLEIVGELSETCFQMVLKCLYLVRIGRPDLLWTVDYFARSVTQWNRACDLRLARLICYVDHTSNDSIITLGISSNSLQTGITPRRRFCWKFGGLFQVVCCAHLDRTRSCHFLGLEKANCCIP